MRILVTNDDGIHAEGLAVLERIARQLSDDVWVVAPETDQSGVAHSLSLSNPLRLRQISERRFAVTGTPTDCVIMAARSIMIENRPDLVLSGVNRGNNAGENVLYSGTIGGAMEAALQGVPAIALSQFIGPRTEELANPFEAALVHGPGLVRQLLDRGFWGADPYRLFYNINFPPLSAAAVKGTRVAAQGVRPDTRFSVRPHLSPTGRKFLWIIGGPQHVGGGPDTDVTANIEGYISVTPMRADLTAHDLIAPLAERLS